MSHTNTKSKEKSILTLLILALIIGTIISLAFIIYPYMNTPSQDTKVTALLYHNGTLQQEIPLWEVTKSYTITLTSDTGGENTILVSPNHIGIISATCADQICVAMGICAHSHLPITCLPNDVMIVLKENGNNSPDMTTY